MTILKILIVLLMLSGTASASVWVDGREIGLAEYQSSGDVAGTYIVRHSLSDVRDIYIESDEIQIEQKQNERQKVVVNENIFYVENNIFFDIGYHNHIMKRVSMISRII